MGRKKIRASRADTVCPAITRDDKKNAIFSEYYQGQEGIIPKDEFEEFMTSMATDLPAVFRVTGFREQSRELGRLIQEDLFQKLMEQSKEAVHDEIDEEIFSPPEQLKWYPGGLTWQLDASRVRIRKSLGLKKLHKFLISESESGFISRQEAVSMIPPLLLEVESHHKILDMCAAPGSKTSQLIELLHSAVPAGSNCLDHPTGMVVANDVDSKRCYFMIHQVLRMQSPAVVITRQDATIFPKMYLPDEDKAGCEKQVLFDRILADVPCSGDGTLRKNPDLWKRWRPNKGTAEHFLQAKILRRGLELLKVGGKLVYSTCSLNPVEDEAVVAHLLSQCTGQVVLTDVRHLLPQLKCQPGISKWRVMLNDSTWLESMPESKSGNLRPSMFPPPNIDEFHMERCMRILPHHQNTGGFFVAVLDKVGELPWMKAAKKNNKVEVEDNATVSSENPTEFTGEDETYEEKPPVKDVSLDDDKKNQNGNNRSFKKSSRVYKEDPFYFMTPDDKDFVFVRKFYELPDTFPPTQLMYRSSEGKRRNFYFTNKIVRDLVQTNSSNGINFINLGVRLFGVSEDRIFNGYRLMHYGVDIAQEIVGGSRRVKVTSRDDLMTLLNYDMPHSTQFSADTMKRFNELSVGPVLIEYHPPEEMPDKALPRVPIVFTGWRGVSSLRHYVSKHGRDHLVRLCGEEPEPIRDAIAKRSGDNPQLPGNKDSCNPPADNKHPLCHSTDDVKPEESCMKKAKIEEEPPAVQTE